MSTGEVMFLALVVGAFLTFSASILYAMGRTNHGDHKH